MLLGIVATTVAKNKLPLLICQTYGNLLNLVLDLPINITLICLEIKSDFVYLADLCKIRTKLHFVLLLVLGVYIFVGIILVSPHFLASDYN